MDSCNSGNSIQSSSCGDEEYDSRAHHHHHPSNIIISTTTPPNFTTTPPSLDPLSNYLDSMQKSPSQNPFLNLDMLWSNPNTKSSSRSEPNQQDLVTFMNQQHQQPSSSSQAFLFNQLEPLSVATTITIPTPHQETPQNMARNPKKRSRASRRAPTTVLTTDTSNFRAMVQEFTGIPSPPFTSSSSTFPRTRFDLFGSSSKTFNNINNNNILDHHHNHNHNHNHPPYLLRPFPHKISQPQPQTFSPSSSSFHTMMNNNNTIQNFGYGSKTQSTLEITPSRKMGVFENEVLGFGNSSSSNASNVGVLQNNMVQLQTSSDMETLSRLNNNNNMRNSSAEWAQRNSSTIGENNESILGSKVVMNNSSSECAVAVTRGGEGTTTVESWINCSSD